MGGVGDTDKALRCVAVAAALAAGCTMVVKVGFALACCGSAPCPLSVSCTAV